MHIRVSIQRTRYCDVAKSKYRKHSVGDGLQICKTSHGWSEDRLTVGRAQRIYDLLFVSIP